MYKKSVRFCNNNYITLGQTLKEQERVQKVLKFRNTRKSIKKKTRLNRFQKLNQNELWFKDPNKRNL